MNASWNALRFVLVVGFLATNVVAVPGVFAPAPVVELLGARPPTEPIWPAFAFLLTFLTSWFFIPAALDPLGNPMTIRLSIAARFVWAGFWYCGYSSFEHGSSPWWWIVELAFGAVQFGLLLHAQRNPSLPTTE
jgi:hypothetical protein